MTNKIEIEIERVRDASAMRAFLSLPYQVYADDPHWVAPLMQIRTARLWRMKPEAPDGYFQLLMVRMGGEVVATCSVMRDPAHDKHKDEHVVFLGLFECINDLSAAKALIRAAAEQAKRWGADTLRGPRGITRIDEAGALVDGRGQAPMMAGHSAPYYQALLEQLGFVKHHDALAYDIEIKSNGVDRPLPESLLAKANAVNIPGLEVRPCDPWKFTRDLDLAHHVMVEGFRDVPENTPLPKAHFRALGMGLMGFTNRHMLQIATVNGQAAGFALCFPEMNEALQAANGSVAPGALVSVTSGLQKIRTASFKLLGIVPEYRGTGLHALMIKHAIDGVRTAGYSRLEASLVDERNKPMRHIVETAGMDVYRRYRVYDLDLAAL